MDFHVWWLVLNASWASLVLTGTHVQFKCVLWCISGSRILANAGAEDVLAAGSPATRNSGQCPKKSWIEPLCCPKQLWVAPRRRWHCKRVLMLSLSYLPSDSANVVHNRLSQSQSQSPLHHHHHHPHRRTISHPPLQCSLRTPRHQVPQRRRVFRINW